METATPQPEQSNQFSSEREAERACPACGAKARRAVARFCAICGHFLNEDYLPADALRASYYLQRRRPGKLSQPRQSQGRIIARQSQQQQRAPVAPIAHVPNRNSASMTALAFVTYSLVPYLGILFCPGAIVMGSLGLLHWHRVRERGGRRTAAVSILLGLLILCAQLLLWWVLYKVPQWARL